MSALSKLLVVLMFGGLGLTAYAGSVLGWGLSGLSNRSTMNQIKQNCPNYYRSPNGDCLRTTFRSYYLMRSVRGGGFGGGK
jgi:hypothetical protein